MICRTLFILDDPAHQAALTEHLGNYDTTIVLSEIPVRWIPSQRVGHRIPDLMVAFNVNRAQAVEQNGYSIQNQGKPPDFVLEIASVRTAENDYTDKRRDYANFGIPEYWRFDPTKGKRYDAPLAGDLLVNGEYQPIEIVEISPDHLHGYSGILNLYVCWGPRQAALVRPGGRTAPDDIRGRARRPHSRARGPRGGRGPGAGTGRGTEETAGRLIPAVFDHLRMTGRVLETPSYAPKSRKAPASGM